MKAQSDTHPPEQIMIRGKTQVNYNVHEVEVEDPEGGTRTAYEYNYVEVAGRVTKAKVIAAMEAEVLEDDDPAAWTPDDAATQYSDANGEIILSGIAERTYAELDAYIESNVTNLAEAKEYLKKISKVVLAMLKKQS